MGFLVGGVIGNDRATGRLVGHLEGSGVGNLVGGLTGVGVGRLVGASDGRLFPSG